MNRLLMLRARGASGPLFQKVGRNTWAKSVGNFIRLGGGAPLAESEVLIPALTSNTWAGGSVFASSVYTTYEPGRQPWYAFDDVYSTISLNAPVPSWIGAIFNTPKVLTKVDITNPKATDQVHVDRCPLVFDIQGSNDGTNWDDLLAVDLNTDPQGPWGATGFVTKTWDIPNTQAYTQYRIYVRQLFSNTAYTQIVSIKFWGY